MILVNGQAVDALPVDDRGLAYGDGLFETLRARNGRLPLLDYHLERLFTGLEVLGFRAVSPEVLQRELRAVAASNPEGIVKLIVTRGSGGRGYRPAAGAEPRRIVMSAPVNEGIGEWRERGVTLRFCKTPLEGPRALDGLKHLNRLAQVMARAEWNDPGIHEGLMRDVVGRIIEGTMSNFFAVRDGLLLTPPVGAGVRGVMRRLVMETALEKGITARERFLSDSEIETADEVFITNSVTGICPVRQIGKLSFRVGTMTRMLQTEVDHALERRTCSEDS